jgi:hypothetical protein
MTSCDESACHRHDSVPWGCRHGLRHAVMQRVKLVERALHPVAPEPLVVAANDNTLDPQVAQHAPAVDRVGAQQESLLVPANLP